MNDGDGEDFWPLAALRATIALNEDEEHIPQRDRSRRPVGWIVLAIAIATVMMQADFQLDSPIQLVGEIIFDVVLLLIAMLLLRSR